MPRWDADAFDGYVRARSTALFRTAYLLTGSRDDALDLVQTVFERLLRARGEAPDNPDAYASAILVNAWRDRLRRENRHRLLHPLLRSPESHDGGLPGIADRTELRLALAELPPAQRAVTVLRVWLDLSPAETAKLLGCSPATVNSHLSRALERLRQTLAEQHRAEGIVDDR
jgi:RNA polymerase sigma-70 factor (sigma-E family)